MSITAKLNRVAPKAPAPKAPKAPIGKAPAPKAPKAPKVAKPVAKVAKVQHTREAAPKASRSISVYQATILVRNADGQTKSMTVSGLEASSLDAALALAPHALRDRFKTAK